MKLLLTSISGSDYSNRLRRLSAKLSFKLQDNQVADYCAVARRADIESGKALKVNVGGTTILLCASGDAIFAIENKCSHAEEPLECGRIRLGWISCPAHGARFDLETGEALNPPAKDSIRTFPVRVDGDVVLVALG